MNNLNHTTHDIVHWVPSLQTAGDEITALPKTANLL